jgi:FHA domain
VRTVHKFGYAFREAPEGVGAVTEQPAAVLYQLVWAGGRATFGEGEHVLGRDPALELCVDLSSVSRRHARLRIARGEAMLEDLGSKDGTFVNGKRLTGPVLLADRDQLWVGSVHATFGILSPQPSTESIGIG